MRRKYASRLTTLVVAAALAAPVWAGEGIVLEIDPQAIVEILPLATEAIAIQQRAMEREAKHAAELRAKGIAEVPPCGSERYVIDTPAFGGFSFDDWGELYIDRRFVTDEEMKTVRKIEAWIAKWFPEQTKKRNTKPRVRKTEVPGPVGGDGKVAQALRFCRISTRPRPWSLKLALSEP